MKEQLKEFILQKLGGKLPDDPNRDTIKVCGIKVFNTDSFDKEFQIIDKYDASSLAVGVRYSDCFQHVILSICGNLTDGHDNRFCMRGVALKESNLDDGIESLMKLMRSGVIQLTGYPASEHPKFNDEDKVDHRTVALLATCDKKWLLSINLKHHMLTLPIGKVHPNESLWQGLCREMWEELGFKLEHIFMGCPPGATALKTKFKKVYDFVRGLSPYPGAWTTLRDADGRDTVLKIFRTTKTAENAGVGVGTLRADRKHLYIACDDCWLQVDELQMAGKKRMDAQAFLNGMKDIENYSVV